MEAVSSASLQAAEIQADSAKWLHKVEGDWLQMQSKNKRDKVEIVEYYAPKNKLKK